MKLTFQQVKQILKKKITLLKIILKILKNLAKPQLILKILKIIHKILSRKMRKRILKTINILIVETTRKNNLIAIVKTTIITKIQNKNLTTKIQETIL